jgi:hypothetical protein
MLDWVSLLLSVFGLSRDRAERIDDRSAEAFRLAAEVSGEVGKALDLIEHSAASHEMCTYYRAIKLWWIAAQVPWRRFELMRFYSKTWLRR